MNLNKIIEKVNSLSYFQVFKRTTNRVQSEVRSQVADQISSQNITDIRRNVGYHLVTRLHFNILNKIQESNNLYIKR